MKPGMIAGWRKAHVERFEREDGSKIELLPSRRWAAYVADSAGHAQALRKVRGGFNNLNPPLRTWRDPLMAIGAVEEAKPWQRR